MREPMHIVHEHYSEYAERKRRESRQTAFLIGVIGVLLLAVVIWISAESKPSSVSTPTAICDKPYIRVANDCCLDQNDNQICDLDDQRIESERKAEELTVAKTTAIRKVEAKLNSVSKGTTKEQVEQILGFNAVQCQHKSMTGGTDCVYETLVDGFKIRFISVYDYKSPGYQYSTTVEAA